MSTVRPRTVSGMRPTGPLHLGHYFGVLKNWVELQHTEEAYFFVADWHALTSDYADPSNIATNVEEMVKDWVAAGLDPEKCVIFRQSAVKEHAELSLLLSMITPRLLAGTQPHLQGTAAADHQQGPGQRGLPLLPRAHGRGHPHVPSPRRARG